MLLAIDLCTHICKFCFLLYNFLMKMVMGDNSLVLALNCYKTCTVVTPAVHAELPPLIQCYYSSHPLLVALSQSTLLKLCVLCFPIFILYMLHILSTTLHLHYVHICTEQYILHGTACFFAS